MNILGFIGCALLSFSALAADIPQDVLGAQNYYSQQCIANATQACINSSCLNSDQIDCQDNCNKISHEKCKEETNE